MSGASNYEIFGIHNDAERYSLAAFHLLVFLSSLLGDSLILYASFHKDAFKLNKFIVTVIQYIAVSDLVYATFTVLTGAISLLAERWVLGDALCYVTVYMGYFIYIAGMSLIAVLTTTKFLLLKFPIRCSTWTERKAIKVCSLILIPPLLFPILFLIVDKDDIGFDYRIYTCNYMFKSDVWTKLKPAAYIITLFIPNIAIVASTTPTLMYLSTARKSARRVKGSVPWQGALTVALTAVVYCVSTLPNFVYHIGESFVDKDPESFFQFHFYRLTESLLMINIMSNFYVYTLTIRSFRRFLLSSLFSVELLASRITTSKGYNLFQINSSISGDHISNCIALLYWCYIRTLILAIQIEKI